MNKLAKKKIDQRGTKFIDQMDNPTKQLGQSTEMCYWLQKKNVKTNQKGNILLDQKSNILLDQNRQNISFASQEQVQVTSRPVASSTELLFRESFYSSSRESFDSSSRESFYSSNRESSDSSTPSHVFNNVSSPVTSVAYCSEDDIGLIISYYTVLRRWWNRKRIYSRDQYKTLLDIEMKKSQ